MEAKPKQGFSWILVAMGVLVAWVVYLLFLGPRRGGEALLAPKFEELKGSHLADYSWPMEDLQGRRVTLAEHRGKTVFLNVWATWCGPCLEEMPAISRLASNPRLKNVAFAAVSVDAGLKDVREYVREHSPDVNLNIYRATTAPPEVFTTQGIPATFILAPDGRIAFAQVGSAQWDDPSVVDYLEKLAPKP